MTPAVRDEPCDLLAWDTGFFGFCVGRVRGETLSPARVKQIDAWCRRHAVRCLYFLARPDHAATARLTKTRGFRRVDIRMMLGQKISTPNTPPPSGAIRLRIAGKKDVPALRALAGKNHRDTRYFQDKRFPRRLSEELYKTWIERSVRGYAQAVLTAVSEKNTPLGYISCHLEGTPAAGRIGLMGVGKQFQGRGIGKALVLGALAWFKAQGVSEVTVVTQGRNHAALSLYQKCGFLPRSIRHWHHKWYRQTATKQRSTRFPKK